MTAAAEDTLISVRRTPEVRAATGQRSPELGTLGGRRFPPPDPLRALAVVHVPLAISAGVFWIFFISYWVPELRGVPGGDWFLTQLSPVASKGLTSQGHALVEVQRDRTGIIAAYLLGVAVLLPALARSRYWLARLALLGLTYLAVIGCVVGIGGLLAGGLLLPCLLGGLLLAAWAITAALTAWRSLWVDPAKLPLRPARALWLLVAYVLVIPAPVAVGRWLFGRELRSAAVQLLDSGVTLRWAALITPTTLSVYAAGVAVGALVAVCYLLVPPRFPGVRALPLLVAGALILVLLVVSGVLADRAAERRAADLGTASPSREIDFPCGAYAWQPANGPTQTVAARVPGCHRLARYEGFREVASVTFDDRLSPVRADTPGGRKIDSDLVLGRYGGVLVLGATGRIDARLQRLVGVRADDLTEIWRFECKDRRPMTVRFVGSDDPEDFPSGRVGPAGVNPSVEVGCDVAEAWLDPANGTPHWGERRR